jgi:small subunit ribosomal protein S8
MTVNCVVNDMLARVRNAIVRRHAVVRVIKSNFCIEILKFCVSRGIFRYLDTSDDYFVEVGLKYVFNKSVIRDIEQVSTPGRRYFVSAKILRKTYSGGTFLILSTKKGLMLREQALNQNIGGLVVCIIHF